jgi:hypothetical protein
VTDLKRWEKHGNVVGTCTQDVRKVWLNRNQMMVVGPKGQGGLIMRILRQTLMILVMMVLRMRPLAIGKVFSSLETEGISCILMRYYGKRKGGFKRRGGIKGREIKRLVF